MLQQSVLREIQDRIDSGDTRLDVDDFAEAARIYQEAISRIPEPRYLHGISLAAYTALGEAKFYLRDYENALLAFRDALKAPGGVENPLLHLRIGQTYYEVGDMDRAADSLTRAYALEGKEIFECEDDKYFSLLSFRIET